MFASGNQGASDSGPRVFSDDVPPDALVVRALEPAVEHELGPLLDRQHLRVDQPGRRSFFRRKFVGNRFDSSVDRIPLNLKKIGIKSIITLPSFVLLIGCHFSATKYSKYFYNNFPPKLKTEKGSLKDHQNSIPLLLPPAMATLGNPSFPLMSAHALPTRARKSCGW